MSWSLCRDPKLFGVCLQVLTCVSGFPDVTWCSEEAMGSCLSCPEKESIPDNHLSKFKVSSCLSLLEAPSQSEPTPWIIH